MILSALQTILAALTILYFAWMVFMHVSTWVYFGRYDRRYPGSGFAPTVSIIKPIYGLDQSAFENFKSFCQQEYAGEYELLFCVERRNDPAIPVIERIIREFPGVRVRLVYSDPRDTLSIGKIKNTITGLAASPFEVVVFSDSDVHAPPAFLCDAVACVQPPEIGLGFGVQAFEGAQNWPAALMNISVNELVLPVATASLYGQFDGAIGTTMVARREVIEQIGGLRQFGRQVVDDIPMGRAVRRKGYQVHLLKQPIRVYHHRDRFTRWWSHMVRWQVIIRHYWPVKSVVNNLLSLGFWWSLGYLIVSLLKGESLSTGGIMLAAVLSASALSTAVINLRFVGCKKLWKYLWVIPILELVRLPQILHSYLTNEIAWRGRRLRIQPDCTVTLIRETIPLGRNTT